MRGFWLSAVDRAVRHNCRAFDVPRLIYVMFASLPDLVWLENFAATRFWLCVFKLLPESFSQMCVDLCMV